MFATAETWIPVVVAVLTGCFGLAVVMVQTVRIAGRKGLEQNTTEHGETKALINQLLKGQEYQKEALDHLTAGHDRIEAKIDGHVTWHAEDSTIHLVHSMEEVLT